MKLALISDQHFDVSSRFEETVRIHDWIADDLCCRGVPDVICLGGDLFERKSVPVDRNAAAAWLLRLADLAPVVGVYGNHETPGDLDVFNHLEAKHPITFYDRPAMHLGVDGLAIACLPWPRVGHLIESLQKEAAANGLPVSVENTDQAARQALCNILRAFSFEFDKVGSDRHAVLLGHVMVRGAKVSVDQPLAPGMPLELGTDDLGLAGAEAYLLGHIHMANEWSIQGAPCLYPGSPRRTEFGAIEKKHYAILTLEHGFTDVEYIDTPATPMVLVDARYHAESGKLVHNVVPDLAGAEVRLRYKVDVEHRDAARQAAKEWRRQAEEAGAIKVLVEEDVTATRVARAPEIVEATTVRDQLQALWRSRNTIPPDDDRERLFAKLATLESEGA